MDNLSSEGQQIWNSALREAAGPLSAYFTPSSYGLENVSLTATEFDSADPFIKEIRNRLDLGRTHAFLSILPAIEKETTTEYRHEITYSQGTIRGKIHMPRLLRARARGERRGIPVLRAGRTLVTPENLLITEVLRLSISVAQSWLSSSDSAELDEALRMLKRLEQAESSYPWVELRTRPRPVLKELVAIVLGRVKTGMTRIGGPIHRLATLFDDQSYDATGFESTIGTSLSTLLTRHPAFEDRVFELLCLAWITLGLRKHATAVELQTRALKGMNRGPLLSAHWNGYIAELFFQTGVGVLPAGQWIDRHSKRPLRALPDIIVRIRSLYERRDPVILLVDAKNRTGIDESDVAYKLLGYKENLN
jgi:hypothetical protein